MSVANSYYWPSDRIESPTYSVVAPVYNEESLLYAFYERVRLVMEGLGERFELVLVDDGSTDGTPCILRKLHDSDHRVKVIRLSRNFGHQAAITAGLDHALGRAVVVMDSDLQDPPEVIPQLVAKWRAGAEVVYARRRSRAGESAFKRLTADLFYRLLRAVSTVDIPRDTEDFRLLDRKVVDALVRMREGHRFLRGLTVWVGFRQEEVLYDRAERPAGRSKYSLRRMLTLAADAILGFSPLPIQVGSVVGAALTCWGLIRSVRSLAKGRAPGAAVVALVSGAQILYLGLLGEYIARIYDDVRRRPLYVESEVLQSTGREVNGRVWRSVV